jgi:ATPase subunit of ABC transporter with duplicated ATPase domains
MPFTLYKSSFDPETLRALQEAFDKAWSETVAVSHDEKSARNMLARRIIDAWRDKGERDPERLKAYALEGFK